MSLHLRHFLFFIAILFIAHCTPKVTEETNTTTEKPAVTKPAADLSTCRKFQDNNNSSDLEDKYVIYRDFLKVNQYDESFEMWKDVYMNAPAADGQRWTVFTDGIAYYDYFLTKETNEAKRSEYIDNILRLYEEMGECYPKQKGYANALLAFDLYYKYPDKETDDRKYELFKEVIDERGMDSYVFVLNPFTKLMADRFLEGKIDTVEAQKYAKLIPEIVDNGIQKGKDLKSWATVRDYSVPYIERLEAIKGFFDCTYYKDKYYAAFNTEDKTCESVTEYYSKLRFGGCAKTDAELVEIFNWLNNNDCIAAPAASDPCSGVVSRAYDALRNGQYQEAVTLFEESIECSSSEKNKGTYNLLISKIYYAHLKSYSKSRQYAREASKFRPDWGDPYILIGKLYASSGPLCGPGRGFDSQVVTWPAIDKWNYAKSIDPSVAAEANKLIVRYRQYMPTREDIFLRQIEEGSTFKVPCWIQENTKVRVAK